MTAQIWVTVSSVVTVSGWRRHRRIGRVMGTIQLPAWPEPLMTWLFSQATPGPTASRVRDTRMTSGEDRDPPVPGISSRSLRGGQDLRTGTVRL
jgi:hypothetical protein